MGQRIAKTVTNKNTIDGTDKFVTTYYVRDPQGNVLAVYEHKHGDSGNGTFTLTEQHLYGASRLGMRKRDLALNTGNASETPATYYELTNHLGNVMAVISDEASTTDKPTIVSFSDYYPFGMTEPGRSWNAGDYRFGYTGHEKEEDLASGVYTTEYRLLDTRLGRWLCVDPLYMKYPGMSSYNYCGGNPLVLVDNDGREIVLKHYTPSPYGFDEPGTWSNMTEEGLSALESFAQTEEGYAILSQFAKKGFKIGAVEFKEDGKYSQHKLVIYDREKGTSGSTHVPDYIGKKKMQFTISFRTKRPNKESILVTLGHEFFIHFIRDYIKAIEVAESEGKGKNEKIRGYRDTWFQNANNDVDHKEYINSLDNPKSFSNFKKYIKQLKKGKSANESKKIDDAVKKHNSLYENLKKKKK